jgi:dipeptidyl aminopeptidase/acylaminoacyl peptidase
VISPAGMHVYECDWSPDGKELAYLAAPGPGDDNWYIAELYAVDAQSGTVRHVLKPDMQVANVRWSPDGQSIAFIGGLMSDEGFTGGDIYSLPASGGAVHDLTPGRKSSPNWFQLDTVVQADSDDRRRFREDGRSRQWIWRPEASRPFGRAKTASYFQAMRTASAMIRSSWDKHSEVWAGRDGRVATDYALERQPATRFGATRKERGMAERWADCAGLADVSATVRSR